jgi:peptide-methionine (S)-S-oxide reductase
VVYYIDEEQQRVAEAYIGQLNAAGVFTSPIVTTVEPLKEFFEAEAYHQNYAALNPNQPYVAYVALPKVEKLRESFPQKLTKP